MNATARQTRAELVADELRANAGEWMLSREEVVQLVLDAMQDVVPLCPECGGVSFETPVDAFCTCSVPCIKTSTTITSFMDSLAAKEPVFRVLPD